MPFHASSEAMVQSTRIWSTSPARTKSRPCPTAWAARIFCVNVMGLRGFEEGDCIVVRSPCGSGWLCDGRRDAAPGPSAAPLLLEPAREADDPVLDRHLRRVVKLGGGAGDVGIRDRHITRLV